MTHFAPNTLYYKKSMNGDVEKARDIIINLATPDDKRKLLLLRPSAAMLRRILFSYFINRSVQKRKVKLK